jgi:hypothetical protein
MVAKETVSGETTILIGTFGMKRETVPDFYLAVALVVDPKAGIPSALEALQDPWVVEMRMCRTRR